MTLAVHRAAAVVLMGSGTRTVRGRRASGCSGAASLVSSRVLGRMTRTVPRVHPARLPFGRGHICMRHLPLHADDELKHQQRCNHPVREPVTHDPQRTPLAAMGEEARLCRKPERAAICAPPRNLHRKSSAPSTKATSRVLAAHVRLAVVASARAYHRAFQGHQHHSFFRTSNG